MKTRARRAGDTRTTATTLRNALGLWRGTALAGVRGEYAQTQRQRLSDLRLSAEAARITSELDLGARAEAATQLKGLIDEHPLDERFRELLMPALYRSGRQTSALDVYRAAQTQLAGDLAVGPGPVLQSLHQRVLRADAGLLVPSAPAETTPPTPAPARSAPVPPQVPTVSAQLRADPPVFVVRDAEPAEMARISPGATVVISTIADMAGVGRTGFAVRWARQVADSFPDGRLHLNLRGFDPIGEPVPPEHAPRTLLESLGADAHGLRRASTRTGRAERRRSRAAQSVDALAGLCRTLFTGVRVLLLLDNSREAARIGRCCPGRRAASRTCSKRMPSGGRPCSRAVSQASSRRAW